MKWLLAGLGLVLLGVCTAQPAEPGDLDLLDDIDEKEFEEYFGLDPVEDPEEFQRREAALRKNEEEIKKVNKEFLEGENTWFDGINEFANLPEDEFLQQKTGAVINSTIIMGRGLLEPPPEGREDQESERYFDQFRYSRASIPSSYSSKDLGLVSPVKNQRQCGSCVAFATMATIETCFKKVTNVFGDYSEQQLVDCGYRQNWANGCHGAPPHAYAKWAGDNEIELAHESQYPYLNTSPNLECPANLPVYNQGARISGSYFTYRGDEELMKKLVYEHGAVVSTVKSAGPFQDYEGGIFAGCPEGDKVDHAIAVVGYGQENGVDYWLVKNSWDENWGENGYIRVKRGVNMCGIGKSMAVVKCTSTSGPTDPPMTTQKPCFDKYLECDQLAKSCHKSFVSNACPRSCGLCEGMTPVGSNTCIDKKVNCRKMTSKHCQDFRISSDCPKSCGLCEMMTPARSNTCKDIKVNCSKMTSKHCQDFRISSECPKSCGLCE